jgi:hypothetical protein
MLVKESGPADGEPENDSRPLHGRGNDVRAVTLLRSALVRRRCRPKRNVCGKEFVAEELLPQWMRTSGVEPQREVGPLREGRWQLGIGASKLSASFGSFPFDLEITSRH